MTYYVDKNHSSAGDSNPGTVDLPWLTIQHAAESLVAGDTVFIRTGVYNENIYIENEGDLIDGYIVFSAYPSETPVIDGTGVTDANNGLVIDKSYIKLIGIEIRNWNENGIWIENAGYLEISDCEVHDVTYGIGAGGGTHDFLLNRVEIHHFDLYGFDASPSGGSDCYNGTFNDCISHTGRDPEQNVDGFALGHGTQHDFVFNRCVVYDVYDGFDISSRNTTLNRCLAYDCWNGGYKLWQDQVALINCIGYKSDGAIVELDWDGDPGTTTLMNCTFYNAQTFTVWIENAGDTLKMYNCILAGGDNIGLAFEQMGVGNYHGDYNLFHNDNTERAIVVGYTDEFSLDHIINGTWTNYSGQDAHSLVSNSDTSLFVNPIQFDLHLLPTSVAVDHGTSTGAPSQDYEGNPRPSGDGYDIGAYEYQHGVDVGEVDRIIKLPSTAMLHQNYPNPFNSTTTISFDLPQKSEVELKIINLLGLEIRTLISDLYNPGHHIISWDGLNEEGYSLPSGVYIYQLKTNQFIQNCKMLLLR